MATITLPSTLETLPFPTVDIRSHARFDGVSQQSAPTSVAVVAASMASRRAQTRTSSAGRASLPVANSHTSGASSMRAISGSASRYTAHDRGVHWPGPREISGSAFAAASGSAKVIIPPRS
jgi:hypothetical protein